jgi:hypothetical protein
MRRDAPSLPLQIHYKFTCLESCSKARRLLRSDSPSNSISTPKR